MSEKKAAENAEAKAEAKSSGTSANGAGASSIYTGWLDALPSLFGDLGDRRGAAGGTADRAANDADSAAVPGRVSQALKLTQQMYNAIYGAYFGALIGRPAGEELQAFESLLRGRIGKLGDQLDGMNKSFIGVAEIDAGASQLAESWLNTVSKLLQPLSTGFDRTYGGLADAFGLAPLRRFEAAVRDMALVSIDQRRAQADYLDVAMGALRQGADALVARLAEMGERGESVDTMLALMRLCANTMDQAMHEAMQSPRALEVSSNAVRASLRADQQRQRIVAIASEALNVPTRAEMDEAYREIQELKREVRRMRKAAMPVHATVEIAPSPAPRSAPARKRKPPANGAKPRRSAAT